MCFIKEWARGCISPTVFLLKHTTAIHWIFHSLLFSENINFKENIWIESDIEEGDIPPPPWVYLCLSLLNKTFLILQIKTFVIVMNNKTFTEGEGMVISNYIKLKSRVWGMRGIIISLDIYCIILITLLIVRVLFGGSLVVCLTID